MHKQSFIRFPRALRGALPRCLSREVVTKPLILQYDLDTYSEAHLIGCNLVDPDMNGGELNIKIPPEAHAGGLVAAGKLVRVSVEFSLEDPQGGVHFVVPEGPQV